MSLPDHQIEVLPHDRNKVEARAQRHSTEGDAAIGASRSNGLRNVRAGRAWRTDADEAIEVHLSAMQESFQQELRTGTRRTHSNAGSFLHDIFDIVEAEWISWSHNNALFAAREGNQDRIVKIRSCPERFDIRVDLLVYRMQMDCRCDKLALDEAAQSCLAALGQRGEARPAFAQRPLQQQIVAPADNRHRICSGHAVG